MPHFPVRNKVTSNWFLILCWRCYNTEGVPLYNITMTDFLCWFMMLNCNATLWLHTSCLMTGTCCRGIYSWSSLTLGLTASSCLVTVSEPSGAHQSSGTAQKRRHDKATRIYHIDFCSGHIGVFVNVLLIPNIIISFNPAERRKQLITLSNPPVHIPDQTKYSLSSM